MFKGAALIGLGLLLLRRSSPASASAATTGLRCQLDPDDTWGRRWGEERPPDLPANARRPCVEWSGVPLVESVAAQQRLGQTFIDVVTHLAETESHATPGLPARPPYRASAGWGIFQFNEGAWHGMGQGHYGCPSPGPSEVRNQNAWDANLGDELRIPIRMYACLYRTVRTQGGSELDAARGVRLWHSGLSYFRTYLRRASEVGSFGGAWADLYDFPPTRRFYDSLVKADGRMAQLGLL